MRLQSVVVPGGQRWKEAHEQACDANMARSCGDGSSWRARFAGDGLESSSGRPKSGGAGEIGATAVDLAKGVHKGDAGCSGLLKVEDDGARGDVGIELLMAPAADGVTRLRVYHWHVHDRLPAAGHPESSALWGSTVARPIRSHRWHRTCSAWTVSTRSCAPRVRLPARGVGFPSEAAACAGRRVVP